MDETVCTWCGKDVPADDGFRLGEPDEGNVAAFCRLEHLVPWVIQGARWEPGDVVEPGEPDDALGRCARCGEQLGEGRLLLVRHRGPHRIGDAFCGLDHLRAWATAGGRWAVGDAPD